MSQSASAPEMLSDLVYTCDDMCSLAMAAFAHIMNNHAHRAVIVKVTSKNMTVVIIHLQLWYFYILRTDTLWTACYE